MPAKGYFMKAQNKKASDGKTSKASHLTVVPTINRNTAMNNSNATDINSQLIQAYNTASEALDAVTQAIEYFGGLHSLFNSIWIQTKDNPLYKDTDVFHAVKMGCYICNDFINSLDCQKEELTNKLKMLGGSHE